MVELFEQDERKNDRQSSKGNQLKWENNGIWYKADYTGYEGLAEYMISHLLKKSTLPEGEFILYDLEKIRYKASVYTGVKSKNFLQPGWQLITLERLFKNFFGESLYRSIYRIAESENRLRFLVNQVERMTGLENFGRYLNKLFTIDALFLNEDRHTHNIAVLMDEKGTFAYAPAFDHGAGLLADTTMDYPMREDVHELLKLPRAKTISADFDEQLDVSEALYGGHLKFYFTQADVKMLLEHVTEYTEAEKSRVETVIYAQMRKYQYLFDKTTGTR
ncbi:MAG: hypothetical protein IJ390_01245 [Lachnospiraceae bacterium]|nr:hypothetical protein [Lachnospiraceae bacterium]